MNIREFSPIFRKSGTIGIICELVGYGCVLACSLLLSDLLERAMAAQPIIGTDMLAAGCLLVSCVLGCVLTCWRGRVRLEDTQAFRTFLYRCVIDRRVSVGTPGEMQGKLGGDANTLAAFFQNTLPKAISGAVVILCATALLCMENLLIGSIFFFLNLIQLLPIFLYENWARQIYEQTHSDEEAYCNWMLEGYRGIRTLKAYGMERWFMARYRQLNRAIVDSGKRAEKTGTVENIVFNAVDSLLNYGSYLVVGLFILCGKAELSHAPYLIVLAGCLFSSISTVFDLRLQQIDSEEACKRLKLRVENVPESDGQSIVRIHAVTKSYDGKPALQGASLDIREGERILLHGPNGSGKSTLLRLLLGLEEPDSGVVRLGIPRQQYAACLQEEPVLSVSGAELLEAMGNCIDKAAAARHLEGFRIQDILGKPLAEMSPGERKKCYLAAALAHKGQLLALDEPTNHLDKQSVSYLLKILRGYRGTLIVCTHSAELSLGWDRRVLVEGGVCHV